MSVAEVDIALVRGVSNPFVRDLHFPTSNEVEAAKHHNEPVRIPSRFRYSFQRATWSVQILEKMESSIQGTSNRGDTYRFNSSNQHSQLLSTYLIQHLNRVVMKKKYRNRYRMAYTPNIMHALVESGNVHYGTQSAQLIRDVWLDIYSQYFMKPGFEKHYARAVGNVPELQEWSNTILPRYDLMLPLPWSYSRHPAVSIPLYMCPMTQISHLFRLRNKLSRLLRFQRLHKDADGKEVWLDVPFSRKYLDNKSDDLPPPEMWAFYSDQDEIETNSGLNGHVRTIYGEDIEYFKSDSEYPLDPNTSVSVNFETTHKTIAKATFWVAQNQTSLKYNYYSNYSTNPRNHTAGSNPVQSMSLHHGGYRRYEKLHAVHTEKAQPWFRFPSPPREPGYNAVSHGCDVTTLHADAGLILCDRSYTMEFVLNHSDFYSDLLARDPGVSDSDSDSESISEDVPSLNEVESPDDKYIIHVIHLVMNKVIYNPREQMAEVLNGFTRPKSEIGH